ncbi:MAG: prepilin peptidase, partial [Planctomycetaceae bacterium]|nr:prepilin peptidase [Planctomycetaceae bacterium]
MNAESVVNALREVSLPAYAGALGLLTALVTGWLTARALRDCDVPSTSAAAVWGLIAGLVTVALTFALLEFKVQETPDVRPSELWWRLRPMYYAILVSLLTVATATDLKTYYILDWTTVSGMVLGVAAATLAGDLQLCHVWVDWNAEVPQLRGPEIPAWLGEHPHWHGLAWSVCGLLTGAGVTWAARFVSSLVLGQQALGFGDVTLMGMIGAFVGWQAVLIVFLLAPLCAVLVGLAVKVVSSRTYIPYGPYLALGAMLVLFNWRTIWLFELDLAT